jgi:hypothetical protein
MERRQHPRAKSDWTARIQREPHSFDGAIKNVSHSGASICCNHNLPPGERVRIAIEYPDRLPLVIDAEVIWSNILGQDAEYGLYRIGLRFVDISGEDVELIDLAVSEYLESEDTGIIDDDLNEQQSSP